MKKLFLLAAVAIFSLSTMNAQGGVQFGAKAGANFSNLNGDDADEAGLDGRTNFHVGGVVNIGINEWFSLQPELIYSMQGYEYDILGESVTGRLNYINIPIMADFTIAEGLSLQGGPQIGINVTSEEEGLGETVDTEAESTDISTGIGAQYELPMGLFFQARYMIGFSDVFEDVDAKNSVISLSVGWFFN
jgi:hypothetical protein